MVSTQQKQMDGEENGLDGTGDARGGSPFDT